MDFTLKMVFSLKYSVRWRCPKASFSLHYSFLTPFSRSSLYFPVPPHSPVVAPSPSPSSRTGQGTAYARESSISETPVAAAKDMLRKRHLSSSLAAASVKLPISHCPKSSLDTLNPVSVIGDKLKLIGEYEETIGTCSVFTEEEVSPEVHEETGPLNRTIRSKSLLRKVHSGPESSPEEDSETVN